VKDFAVKHPSAWEQQLSAFKTLIGEPQ